METGSLLMGLRAVAEPTRLRMLGLLAGWHGPRSGPLRSDEPGMCLSDLVLAVGLSHALVLHHLKTLCQAHLVETERRGRWAIYRVRAECLRPLAEALLDLGARHESPWASQLPV